MQQRCDVVTKGNRVILVLMEPEPGTLVVLGGLAGFRFEWVWQLRFSRPLISVSRLCGRGFRRMIARHMVVA